SPDGGTEVVAELDRAVRLLDLVVQAPSLPGGEADWKPAPQREPLRLPLESKPAGTALVHSEGRHLAAAGPAPGAAANRGLQDALVVPSVVQVWDLTTGRLTASFRARVQQKGITQYSPVTAPLLLFGPPQPGRLLAVVEQPEKAKPGIVWEAPVVRLL